MSGSIYQSGQADNLPIWAQSLQPASFNGMQFGVVTSEFSGGRRQVVHTYPFKDLPYVEDLGEAPQFASFNAYLIGDDVYAQQTQLKAQFDAGGVGTLVHPSLGSVYAQLMTYSLQEDRTRGRMVSINVEFVITSQFTQSTIAPTQQADTSQTSDNAADDLDDSASDDFISRIDGIIHNVSNGIIAGANATVYAIQGITSTISGYASEVASAVNDAGNLVNSVQGIGYAFGAAFTCGRYANGNLTQAPACLASLSTGLSTQATLQQATALLIAASEASRLAVTQAASVAAQAVNTSGVPSVPGAVQSLTVAFTSASNAPADAVRLLASLASYTSPTTNTGGAISASVTGASNASAALARRAALSSLGRACAAYAPGSVTDAQSILTTVTPLFDAEISYASTIGDSATQGALKRLKTAIIQDMNSKATGLVPVVTLTLPSSIPLKRLAMNYYGDASQENEILQRNPQIAHPLFSGLTIELLANGQ